jgi:hypothetical protein
MWPVTLMLLFDAIWSLVLRTQQASILGFLSVFVLAILFAGIRSPRVLRAARDAFLTTGAALAIAFLAMQLPNPELDAWCNQPGARCEGLLGAMLLYASPFLLVLGPFAAVLLNGAWRGTGALVAKARTIRAHRFERTAGALSVAAGGEVSEVGEIEVR